MTRPRRPEIMHQPLYARMLRLRYLTPGGFLCFVFLEGAVALGILLALAELVSWWGVLVLPATVAAMVKLNDIIAGVLTPPVTSARAPRSGAGVPRPASPGPVRAGGGNPLATGSSGATAAARPTVPGQALGALGPSTAMAQAARAARSGPEPLAPVPGEQTTRLPGFVAGRGEPVKRPWAERLEADQQRARQSATRRYD